MAVSPQPSQRLSPSGVTCVADADRRKPAVAGITEKAQPLDVLYAARDLGLTTEQPCHEWLWRLQDIKGEAKVQPRLKHLMEEQRIWSPETIRRRGLVAPDTVPLAVESWDFPGSVQNRLFRQIKEINPADCQQIALDWATSPRESTRMHAATLSGELDDQGRASLMRTLIASRSTQMVLALVRNQPHRFLSVRDVVCSDQDVPMNNAWMAETVGMLPGESEGGLDGRHRHRFGALAGAIGQQLASAQPVDLLFAGDDDRGYRSADWNDFLENKSGYPEARPWIAYNVRQMSSYAQLLDLPSLQRIDTEPFHTGMAVIGNKLAKEDPDIRQAWHGLRCMLPGVGAGPWTADEAIDALGSWKDRGPFLSVADDREFKGGTIGMMANLADSGAFRDPNQGLARAAMLAATTCEQDPEQSHRIPLALMHVSAGGTSEWARNELLSSEPQQQVQVAKSLANADPSWIAQVGDHPGRLLLREVGAKFLQQHHDMPNFGGIAVRMTLG